MTRKLTIRDGFALFWREWPSNWEASPFNIGEVRYNCVEQWMMAEKARTFGDFDSLRAIMDASHPREQKSLGRTVANYNEERWSKVRFDVVVMGTVEKYRQNPHLKALLLAVPPDVQFVEASPYDRIWGIGMDEHDPRSTDPAKWLGLNLLGKAIDAAAAKIRAESPPL